MHCLGERSAEFNETEMKDGRPDFKPRLWVMRNLIVKKIGDLGQADGWFLSLGASSSVHIMSLVKIEWLSREIFAFGNREFWIR